MGSSSEQQRSERLSPTNLAVYHHNHCELYLWNTYHGKQRYSGVSIEPTPLTKAQYERGNEWESTLVSWLDVHGLLLALSGPTLTGADIASILQLEDRDRFFLYGLKFQSPEFLEEFERYGNGSRTVKFGIAKPDLIEFTRSDGRLIWRVMDAKASKKAKTSHHVQIFWYHMCLRHVLKDPIFAPSDNAAVWLPPDDFRKGSAPAPSFTSIEPVAITLLARPLEEFFFGTLPRIIHKEHGNVSWHYNPLCRGCPFERDCRDRALTEGALGAMPDISLSDVSVLLELKEHARELCPEPQGDCLSDLEDLNRICRDNSLLVNISMNFPISTRRARGILQLPRKLKSFGSPKVTAALTQRPQIIPRRNYTLPVTEDMAIIISLLLDPASSSLGAYCISIYKSSDFSLSQDLPKPAFGIISVNTNELVIDLAQRLNWVMDLNQNSERRSTTQIYVFSGTERSSLQQHLINAALSVSSGPGGKGETEIIGAVKTCIGTICEGSNLLATVFQPIVLSGALLGFLHKRASLTKEHLRTLLKRLGVNFSPNDSKESLRSALEMEIKHLQSQGGLNEGSFNLGNLSRVIALRDELDKLIAFPSPGYWDLQDAVSLLLSKRRRCTSDDEIYAIYKTGEANTLKEVLVNRNKCLYDLLNNVRKRVNPATTGGPHLLLSNARPLLSQFMDICQEAPLRKLFFMHQFEVLTKLQILWQKRSDGCPDSPVVEYANRVIMTGREGQGTQEYEQFRLLTGSIEPPSEKEKVMFDYILVPDYEQGDELPVEALFNDLLFCGLVFPLNKSTRRRWESQSMHVRTNIAAANLSDLGIIHGTTAVLLQVFCTKALFKLTPGQRYRLSPRLIDFNTSKVLHTLVEVDLDCMDADYLPSFMRLLTGPDSQIYPPQQRNASLKQEQAIHRQFKELKNLGVESAGALMLKESQRKATRRILTSNLAVIWGPPGTGKTYTIALSFLRMIEVEMKSNPNTRKIVFLTAMTHVAIEAILKKLDSLLYHYRNVPDLPLGWLDKLSVQHVRTGGTHPLPGTHNTHLFAGTVFQLWHYGRRLETPVDMVIIDEAGQLSLGYAALVMRNMSPDGKLVVAGDSEQLAPIFSAEYPESEGHLFGSVLDCLMQSFKPSSQDNEGNEPEIPLPGSPGTETMTSSQASLSTVVQLLENFRLNPDLGAFVSTIYSRRFHPQKSQARELATRLISLEGSSGGSSLQQQALELVVSLGNVMLGREQMLFTPPSRRPIQLTVSTEMDHRDISLALISLNTLQKSSTNHSVEVHIKAEAALAVAIIQQLQKCAPHETVFVATPHRIQRQAVRLAISTRSTMQAVRSKEDELAAAMESFTLGESTETGQNTDTNTKEESVAANGFPGSIQSRVTVDTVERLQGSEAGFVICLFSQTHREGVAADTNRLSFLLNRRRLNVAISRAKTLCIFVTSNEVLRPPATILADPESTKGYMYLRAYEERACCARVSVNLDDYS